MTRAAMLVLVLLGRLALASGAGAQPEASQPARLGLAATAGTILGPPTVGTIATVPSRAAGPSKSGSSNRPR